MIMCVSINKYVSLNCFPKINLIIIILLSAGLLVTPAESHWIGDCWETWSRCSQWSSGATGILWLSCNGRCIQLGRAGGNCNLVKSKCPIAPEPYQCQCYRRNLGSTNQFLARISSSTTTCSIQVHSGQMFGHHVTEQHILS
ncbi:Hydramacin-1 [Bulinus truncatus]|nr:Hydramacin-1 [Bulinus truncatus]